MGIKYNDFKIRGIDVSEFQGVIDWSKVQGDFAVIRVGYGLTIEPKYKENIEAAKLTNLDLMAYWYGDYYSNWFRKVNAAYGLSDSDFGRKQADLCYEQIKNQPVKMVWLDCESITTKGYPALSDSTAKGHAIAIFKAFIERMQELGVKVGIYTSLGWLSWCPAWFRNLPLWVAWYPFRSAEVDLDDVIYMCQRNGWEVKPLIWQYASDGDLDDNGTGDGYSMGMQSKTLDLNAWIGTEGDFKSLFGETPDDEAAVIPEPLFKEYTITAWPYLFIREGMTTGSKKLGLYYQGTKVHIEKVENGWAKLYGQHGWVSDQYLK